MPVTDVSILKKKRKNKKLTKLIIKLSAFFVIAIVVVVIVFTKELWYPKLDGLLTKIPVFSDSSSSDRVQFPLEFTAGTDYQLTLGEDIFSVVDDSHFYVYASNGAKNFSLQHTYNSPSIDSSYDKSLIYDLGGASFSLVGKYKQDYEKTTEFPILFARISETNYAAVVTKHDKFTAYLMIYDKNGNNIFNYGSVDHIIDVTLSPDNNSCYITTLSSVGGVIVTNILYYTFDKINYDEDNRPIPVWKTENLETMGFDTEIFAGNRLMVIGDTKAACYMRDGNLVKEYDYDFELAGYSLTDEIAVLLFNNTAVRNSEVLIIDGVLDLSTTKTLDFISEYAEVCDKMVYVQNKNKINTYSSEGSFISEITLESKYNKFEVSKEFIYLLGYDKIDRVNITS